MLKLRVVSIDDSRRQQSAQIFNIYNLYRLLLSLILLISYLFTADFNFLGSVDSDLYFRASIAHPYGSGIGSNIINVTNFEISAPRGIIQEAVIIELHKFIRYRVVGTVQQFDGDNVIC